MGVRHLQVQTKRYNEKKLVLKVKKKLLHAYIFMCFVGASTTLLMAVYPFYIFFMSHTQDTALLHDLVFSFKICGKLYCLAFYFTEPTTLESLDHL